MRPNPPATAEDWVVRLQAPDCDAHDHAAFETWLAVSPAHPAAFAHAERLHALSATLSDDPALRADAARAYRALRARAPVWRRPWALATAAAVVLAGVLGYRMLLTLPADLPAPMLVQTAPGELRTTATLTDGSRLVLDVDSTVEVAFAPDSRVLTLQRGRMHIVAAHDVARPMHVRAGDGEIRVTGTTFQVQRTNEAVDVSLLEGAVEVHTGAGETARNAKLAAGQRLRYREDGSIEAVQPLRLDETSAWLDGRLVFEDWPLDALIAQANRYSAVKLVLSEPALADIRVSGQVQAGDQDTLVAALEAGWGLHVQRRDAGTIVLGRR